MQMSTVSRHTLVLVLACLAGPIAGAAIDEELEKQMVGEIGETMREQFAGFLIARGEASKAMQMSNDQIREARRRFFAQLPNGPRLKQREAAFADALLGKDMFFLTMYAQSGMKGAGLHSFQALAGGPLDGGIAQPAMPAFAGWVNAVRASLGAKSETDFLHDFSKEQLQRALTASLPQYRQYKAERDRCEMMNGKHFQRYNGHNPDANDAMLPLYRRVPQGFPGRADRISDNNPIKVRLLEMIEDKTLFVDCWYGPGTSEGGSAYEHVLFWNRLPDDLRELQAMDAQGNLGSFGAYTGCPKTNAEAKALKKKFAEEGLARLRKLEQESGR